MMIMHEVLYPRDDIDGQHQEKKEEIWSTITIASMHQHKDSKTTLKRAKEETAQTT